MTQRRRKRCITNLSNNHRQFLSLRLLLLACLLSLDPPSGHHQHHLDILPQLPDNFILWKESNSPYRHVIKHLNAFSIQTPKWLSANGTAILEIRLARLPFHFYYNFTVCCKENRGKKNQLKCIGHIREKSVHRLPCGSSSRKNKETLLTAIEYIPSLQQQLNHKI